MNCFSEEQLNRISHLIREIEKLSDVEKLFLYLQLPCGRAEGTEGKSKFNGPKSSSDLLSKKPDQETTQTYTWILSHLEVDPNVSLPKQEVYDEYRTFCQTNRFEPLCVADFGKAMKHAFPCIKPRRLGQRGNSRYCYSGLRKKYKIQPPNLPDMIEPTFCMDHDCSQAYNQIIRDCRDNPEECPLNRPPNFTGYEVMNLKIDPSSQHNQFHSSNSNGATYNSREHHPGGKQSNVQQQSSQAIEISGGHRPRPNHTADTLVIQSTTPGSVNEYVPSNPIPIINSNNHHHHGGQQPRYNYGGVIKQPGSPDDDDYQHNYQDVLHPMSRHLFTNSAAPNTIQVPHQSAIAANTTQSGDGEPQPVATSNFIYHQQSNTSTINKQQPPHPGSSRIHDGQLAGSNMAATAATQNPDDANNTDHDDLVQNHPHGPHFSGMNSPVQNNGITVAGNGSHVNLSHMNGSYIDSCASPFQSPAPTPYTMMGSYTIQDVQDYYTNDFIRYSGS